MYAIVEINSLNHVARLTAEHTSYDWLERELRRQQEKNAALNLGWYSLQLLPYDVAAGIVDRSRL